FVLDEVRTCSITYSGLTCLTPAQSDPPNCMVTCSPAIFLVIFSYHFNIERYPLPKKFQLFNHLGD
ncbi:hypothetical protein SB775_29245, partial [Peribacillus sp. SIMBA_075]|uniref:hypothetical protein n=1 Tax=Peribacillus sp. SIMBA_075 TaxID=3085813 RepID=UPI00397C676A